MIKRTYANGKVKPKLKKGDIVKWLKEDFELGHGHSMAIDALLKVEKIKRANYKAGVNIA